MNLLIALDALLTEQNITRAALRINLSQSGMSTALSRLRLYFEDELLVPVGRKMVPTPLAQSYVAPVKAIILQTQALINSRPRFDPASSQRNFTLWASDYITCTFLPRVLQHMEAEAPDVSLEHVPMTVQPQTLLERGEVDLMIIPDELLAAGHPSQKLFSEEYVCISWLDNPHTCDGVNFDTYFSLRHVVTRFGQTRSTGLDEIFLDRFAQRRRIGTMALSLTALPYSVVGTHMLATIHRRMAEQFATHLPLRISSVPVEIPSFTEALQWHQFREQDPGITWLRELICRTASEFNTTAEKQPAARLKSRGSH